MAFRGQLLDRYTSILVRKLESEVADWPSSSRQGGWPGSLAFYRLETALLVDDKVFVGDLSSASLEEDKLVHQIANFVDDGCCVNNFYFYFFYSQVHESIEV